MVQGRGSGVGKRRVWNEIAGGRVKRRKRMSKLCIILYTEMKIKGREYRYANANSTHSLEEYAGELSITHPFPS